MAEAVRATLRTPLRSLELVMPTPPLLQRGSGHSFDELCYCSLLCPFENPWQMAILHHPGFPKRTPSTRVTS
jgi:hypothetical protein